MRRFQSVAVGLVMAFSTMLMLSSAASANPVAGGGYSSSYAGESAFTSNGTGETGQFSAIFFNDGTIAWSPGVVGLLICAADKQTCNVPSNSTYAKNWFSSTVYATVTTTVQPGQNGFFIYSFTVPAGTPPGTATTFYGDVGLIATGAMLRPEGYYQVNTAPAPSLSLVVSPNPSSVQVGQTLQYTVTNLPTGAVPTWSVLGGCGAVTATGLFAATAMNSASQPCSVIATVAGTTGSSAVTVFGNPSQLGCSATPTTLVANGGATASGIAVAKIALKDANGNTVTNAGSPTINAVNVTPTLASMTPTGAISPSAGVATVTITTTSTPGDIQLSASASGITGCNLIVTSSGAGAATKTVATFLTNPIASDGTSNSSLQVDVTDANGNRVTSDTSTQLTVTRDAGSTNVCNVTAVTQGTGTGFSNGGGQATAVAGRIAFTVTSTSTPGQCLMIITTNNSSIAGTSATLTTQIVGAPNKLAVISNNSPHNAANPSGLTCQTTGGSTDQSCTTIVVGVQDVNGALVTNDNGQTITATLDSSTCSGAGGGAVANRGSTLTSSGKATFVFSSQGAYANCTITFSRASVSSVSTTAVWSPGGADHLACVFAPTPIPPDNNAQSFATVSVRDSLGNALGTGTYSVSFSRVSGSATVMLTSSPQQMTGGYAVFAVRSQTTVGSDTYGPAMAQGSLPGSNTTCIVAVQ
jgi:hypothetical protein